MTDFLDRLRERKIAQWALAYPALAVGLFVTLVLAWYHGEQGRQRVTGPELLILADPCYAGLMRHVGFDPAEARPR